MPQSWESHKFSLAGHKLTPGESTDKSDCARSFHLPQLWESQVVIRHDWRKHDCFFFSHEHWHSRPQSLFQFALWLAGLPQANHKFQSFATTGKQIRITILPHTGWCHKHWAAAMDTVSDVHKQDFNSIALQFFPLLAISDYDKVHQTLKNSLTEGKLKLHSPLTHLSAVFRSIFDKFFCIGISLILHPLSPIKIMHSGPRCLPLLKLRSALGDQDSWGRISLRSSGADMLSASRRTRKSQKKSGEIDLFARRYGFSCLPVQKPDWRLRAFLNLCVPGLRGPQQKHESANIYAFILSMQDNIHDNMYDMYNVCIM